jgi:hypothetical protein
MWKKITREIKNKNKEIRKNNTKTIYRKINIR